jgi:hypothetical protein
MPMFLPSDVTSLSQALLEGLDAAFFYGSGSST